MSARVISYFYVLTVQLVNPAGGQERVSSASGIFYDSDDLTEEGRFATALLAATEKLHLRIPLKPNLEPNLSEFSVLFYRCVPNVGGQHF